jgi:hypothetical protein
MSHMPRKTVLAILVLVVSGVAAVPALAAKEPKTLRLNLKPGTTHRYGMTIEQSMEMGLGPMGNQKVRNKIRMDLHQTVKDRTSAGNVVMEVVYDRVRMEMTVPGAVAPMVFDTADPGKEGNEGKDAAAADPLGGMRGTFGKMLGKPLTLTLSPRGELVAVDGMDALFADLATLPPDASPQARAISEQVKSSFGPDFVKAMLQQTQPVFPEGPLAQGTTWTQSTDMSNPVLGKITSTTRFASMGMEAQGEREAVKVGMTSALEFSGEAPLKQQLEQMIRGSGAPADTKFDWRMSPGAGSGTAWFDLDTGRTLRLEFQQPMAATFEVSGTPPAGSEGPSSMSFEMKMDVKTTLEALD